MFSPIELGPTWDGVTRWTRLRSHEARAPESFTQEDGRHPSVPSIPGTTAGPFGRHSGTASSELGLAWLISSCWVLNGGCRLSIPNSANLCDRNDASASRRQSPVAKPSLIPFKVLLAAWFMAGPQCLGQRKQRKGRVTRTLEGSGHGAVVRFHPSKQRLSHAVACPVSFSAASPRVQCASPGLAQNRTPT